MKLKLFGAIVLISFICACGGGERLTIKSRELLIVNSFDEFLRGDLDDYVTGGKVKDLMLKEDVIALSTTLRERFGEVFACDGKIYYADPDDGKAVEMEIKSEERLPFFAAAKVDVKDKKTFDGVKGNLEGWIIGKMKEMGIKLAAVKVEGEFSKVKLVVTRRIPREGTKFLKRGTNFVTHEFNGLDSGKDFEMAGICALGKAERGLISAPQFPVRLSGRSKDNAYSGFVIDAYAKKARVTIHPLQSYTLVNKVF